MRNIRPSRRLVHHGLHKKCKRMSLSFKIKTEKNLILAAAGARRLSPFPHSSAN
jgi:hypothetical protein